MLNVIAIPPELLSDILSYACTDTGETGCALGLTCKTFRDLCLDTGIDLQFVSICGAARLAKFLEMLRRRDEQKRKVFSLFMSHTDGGDWRDSQLQRAIGTSRNSPAA